MIDIERDCCVRYFFIMKTRRVAKKRRQIASYVYSRKYHATSIKLSVISFAGAQPGFTRLDDFIDIIRCASVSSAFHITADRDAISTSD